MSSADSPRFDATAAAQQMLDLEVQAEQASLPAQQRAVTTAVHEPPTQSGGSLGCSPIAATPSCSR